MKTIKQALIDEIFYPINEGLIDNKLMIRNLDGSEEISKEVMLGDNFQGALADCLVSVVEQAVNFSEADKNINVPTEAQLLRIKTRINSIYHAIGEAEINLGSPSVYFGED